MQKYFNYIIKKITSKYKIQSILVAISGGQDSMCLIKLFESFNNINKSYKIEYIYIDHQWRMDSEKQIKHIGTYFKFLKKKFMYIKLIK